MALETGILIRLREGDPDAFKIIYEKYSDKIFYVSVRFGLGRDDSNEIVQDVFLKVWERRHDIRIDLSFNAYLLTIAKNFIIKKATNSFNNVAVNNYLAKESKISHNDTEDLIVYADLLKVMDTFIESLPPQQREIFKLNKIEQYGADEISSALEISKRTVENHLFRANNKLKLHLKSLGIHMGKN